MNRYSPVKQRLFTVYTICRLLPMYLLTGLLLLVGVEGRGQHSITGGNLNYTQDFNAFAGTNLTLPVNWTWVSGAAYGNFYNRNGVYNEAISTYGLRDNSGSGDIAFGGKFAAGSNNSNTLIFTAVNNTGSDITGFALGWNVEQYSECVDVTTISFSYSVNNTSFVTSNITGSPNSSTTTGASCSNLGSINAAIISISINAILPAGQNIRFRFSFDNPNSDNAHAGVDDFSMTAIVPCTPPSIQATAFGTSGITSNQMTVNWTRGNGNNVLVVAREGTAVNNGPVNGTTYTASPVFGSGTQIGTGNFVVYKGSGTSIVVTGLNSSKTYHFAIYEFNDAGLCYRASPLTGNANTLAPPPPTVTHNGTATPAANIQEGSINNVLYQIQIIVANAPVTLNALSLTTGGNWTTADITNFKLRYSTDSNLDMADPVLATVTTGLTGGSQSITIGSLSRQFLVGTSYLFITCDVKLGAVIGNTVSARANVDANFSYSPGTVVFSDSNFPAANLMTIVGRAIIQLENASGNPLDCSGTLNFGTLSLGFDTLLTVQVHNAGTADLTLNSIQLANNQSTSFVFLDPHATPVTIAPDDLYELEIIFSPQSSGSRSGTLTILSNSFTGATCILNLSGTGTASPDPVFPDIVTPNDDGHNDFFSVIFPTGTVGSRFELEVFNRAGGMVKAMDGEAIQSSGPQQIWSPAGCPDGVYYYRLTFNEAVYRGAVTVIGRQQP